MSLRYLLPVYLLAYVVIAAFFWRSYAVWKRTGVNPLVFKGSDSAHDFIGRVTKALFGLVVAVVVIHAFIPSAYQYVMPITWLERPWVRWTGVILLLASLVWTVLAQAQMGHSWRIGIDYEHRTPLVRSGIFKFSRNPIFLGMMLTLLGLFLIVPNTLTLLSLVMGVVLIQIQVRLEEFLAQTHGEEYERYKRVGTED